MRNLILVIITIFCFNTLKSQSTNNTDQLAGLCKVWGLVKFYHPDVTKKKIDWDKMLINKYSEFKAQNDFEAYNQKIINLLDTLSQNKKHKPCTAVQFDAIISDKLEQLSNFSVLSDTNKYINRISFSWINDPVFSKETKYKLAELLVNYKPYESKLLKGKFVIKHKEDQYLELDSITEPYRVLGLFRYWNTINYYYPHKHIIDHNWDTVLTQFIPSFINVKTHKNYIRQIMELAEKIDDSHGFYNHFTYKYYKKTNKPKEERGYVPYNFRLIDNKVIVSKVLIDSAVLQLGDIVVKIDTTNLVAFRKLVKKYRSHSTEQSAIEYFERTVSNLYNTKFTFVVIRKGDTLTLTEFKKVKAKTKKDSRFRKPPYYYSLNDNAGYIDLAQIKFGEHEKALKTFKDKEFIVFDIRGYPDYLSWLALPHLLRKKPKNVATYYYPNKKYPGTFINKNKGEHYRIWFVKPFLFLRKQYKGKIVVLINNEAISQSETVCMMFKAYGKEVTFIGTPTMGANGDVSSIYMPGGLSINFTSLDWHYPNGDQLQRVGVIPDIYVKETVEGLISGKDEILERAIQFTEQSSK